MISFSGSFVPAPLPRAVEQKELAGAREKLLAVNQTREDSERPWPKRVQELEQQLIAAAEEQKRQQTQSLAAKQEAQTRIRDGYRELEQDEQEESDRKGLADLLKDKIRLLDRLAYLQESLRLPVTGTKLRDNSDVMVSAKASVLAQEVRLAYFSPLAAAQRDPSHLETPGGADGPRQRARAVN